MLNENSFSVLAPIDSSSLELPLGGCEEYILPRHVAIIMDGNGRWAKKRGFPRVVGHKSGAEAVKKVVRAAVDKGIEVLSLWAFGTENWGRPAAEVSSLMNLFIHHIRQSVLKLHEENVQFRVIGNKVELNAELQKVIAEAEDRTANNTGLKLLIAINYSGRWDITQAVQKIARKVADQELLANDITSEHITRELCFSDLPDPDLLIRTSGEIRISNFMLWQLAYTELYFTDTLWPDFNIQELDKALGAYAERERRYGTINK